MSQVLIENLTKAFPEKGVAGTPAVAGIHLEVRSGEFMVLVGPSGCGKSTTLRMIAGLEDITAGTISIEGRVVNDLPPKDRDIAMVFQNYALYPHLSVFDNLAFALKLRRLPRAEIEERVRAAAEMLGLTDLLARKPKALSGGQRQRVALGRAIVRRPRVFLFDEPLSNLDAMMRVVTRAEIARLHQRLGATMIYVTHDQAEAMTLGDRICVMRSGRILQVAEPMELYNHPANAFVAGFIGSPPMNFLRGTLEPRDGALFFHEENPGKTPLVLPLAADLAARASAHVGRPILLGVRPEHIRPAAAGTARLPGLRIEVVEPMGAETILHLQTGAHALFVRADPQQRFVVGNTFVPDLSTGDLHLFDPQTEQVI